VLVTTDEPGALVQVDGLRAASLRSFSSYRWESIAPDLLRGFRAIERQITVAPGRQTRIEEELTRTEEVQAASRSAESVDDARPR